MESNCNSTKTIESDISDLSSQESSQKVCKVFVGAEKGVQAELFTAAWYRSGCVDRNWRAEYIYTRHVNLNHWSPSTLVDWLLDSDFHIILTHVHQGIVAALGWNMEDLEEQLQRLASHNGFPNGCQLKCPVFLQDKFIYLKNLPNQKVNSTLQIFLTEDQDYYTQTNYIFLDKLQRFLLENNEGDGWVLKAPYTTNSHYIRFVKNITDVVQKIANANTELFSTMRYVMLQACMKNRKEYKVVMFDEKVQYLGYNPYKRKNCFAFSKRPHEKLFAFAQEALLDLKTSCNDFISDGLVRVDIFINKSGDMVVNEFESLEANYHAHGISNAENIKNTILTEKLIKYWYNKILFFANSV